MTTNQVKLEKAKAQFDKLADSIKNLSRSSIAFKTGYKKLGSLLKTLQRLTDKESTFIAQS